MPDLWGLATIAAKFALYLGVLTSVGTLLAALIFRLPVIRGFILGFAALGIAGTIFGFFLTGAALTGDASGMVDSDILGLIWTTPVGTAASLRVAGLSLLIAGLFAGRYGLFLSLMGCALALWSFAHIGHIPDKSSPTLNIILLFHLVAISMWVGILTPLRALSLEPGKIAEATALGHRFGKMATVFVPLLILAGVYMSYALVGSFSVLIGSGYGQTLVLKILFVGALLGLAAANKIRFIPRMSSGDQSAALHLAKAISLEWFVIAATFLATAIITSVLTLPS